MCSSRRNTVSDVSRLLLWSLQHKGILVLHNFHSKRLKRQQFIKCHFYDVIQGNCCESSVTPASKYRRSIIALCPRFPALQHCVLLLASVPVLAAVFSDARPGSYGLPTPRKNATDRSGRVRKVFFAYARTWVVSYRFYSEFNSLFCFFNSVTFMYFFYYKMTWYCLHPLWR